MNSIRTFLSISICLLFILGSCGQKSNDHHEHEHASDPVENGGNQVLYDEVMKVHDEVMPKMDDIYRLKEELKNKIANAPDMKEDVKREIESKVSQLDSAADEMMDWMHQFNPIPDSVGQEKAREYLENEMEKIKKVREDIYKAIEKARADQ